MQDTLTYIIKAIVVNEEAVSIDEHEEDGFVTLTITVDPSEIGKVIGKEGKIIRSIRNVMKIMAIKQNKKINVTLADTPQQTT